jgi:hypothetical protein
MRENFTLLSLRRESHMSQLLVLQERLRNVPPADTSGSYSEHQNSLKAQEDETQKRFNEWKQGLAVEFAADLSPAAQEYIFEKAWEDGCERANQYNLPYPHNQVEREYASLAAFAQGLQEL